MVIHKDTLPFEEVEEYSSILNKVQGIQTAIGNDYTRNDGGVRGWLYCLDNWKKVQYISHVEYDENGYVSKIRWFKINTPIPKRDPEGINRMIDLIHNWIKF